MKNYAGVPNADDAIASELSEAGIEVFRLPEFCRGSHPEMRTVVLGDLHGWKFERQWYYWAASGPGIDVETAEALHAVHGKVVRVDGHCGCPSPREWFKGLACGNYHVDSQEGLNALAQTINSLVAKSSQSDRDSSGEANAP